MSTNSWIYNKLLIPFLTYFRDDVALLVGPSVDYVPCDNPMADPINRRLIEQIGTGNCFDHCSAPVGHCGHELLILYPKKTPTILFWVCQKKFRQ